MSDLIGKQGAADAPAAAATDARATAALSVPVTPGMVGALGAIANAANAASDHGGVGSAAGGRGGAGMSGPSGGARSPAGPGGPRQPTGPPAAMPRRKLSMFDRALVGPALIDSFRKLDPRVQWRNPVMFVVYIGSILTTALWVQALGGAGEAPAW